MKSVLDSRQLLAARVLADTGSFTLAGQHLCLTQSAVSHAIKALETEVECQLFVRSGKGVTVTPAGKHFLQYTDRILEQMETARTLVTPRTTSGRDYVRLGVNPRASQLILPVVRPQFQKEFPNRLVPIASGTYHRNLELLAGGLLDLSFTVRTEYQAELEFIPLFEDELRFIVAADHPWAEAGAATCTDLPEMLMVFQDSSNTAHLLAAHLKMEKVTARRGVALADHDAIKSLARTGQAVGVISPWLASKELQEGSLVSLPIGSRPLRREWGLAHLRRHKLAPMELRFVELCRQAIPGLLGALQGKTGPAPAKKETPVVPALAAVRASVGGSSLVVAVAGVCANWACSAIEWTGGVTELLASCG